MYQNIYYPLRSIVGNAIPIRADSILKVFESEESKNLRFTYEFGSNNRMIDGTANTRWLLPEIGVDQTRILPGEGMSTLPLPSPFPFKIDDQGAFFSAIHKLEATTDVSRKLSVRYSIQLPDKFLVGGVCFGGFPYATYSPADIHRDIRPSNFGLPREIRLTCVNGAAEENQPTYGFDFLDAEISATKQDLISHSGFHFLCIDPTLTNVVTVHFSDYPTILREVKYDNEPRDYKETILYGFFIPHFYLFEYQEKTRYRPVVATGLLGTTTSRQTMPDIVESFANSAYYRYIQGEGELVNYFDFTAASIFGQQREYKIRGGFYDGGEPQGNVKERLQECFISIKVDTDENVVLFIEQGEEYERCLAGVKILMPFDPFDAAPEDLDRIAKTIKEFYPHSTDFWQLVESMLSADDTGSDRIDHLEEFWQSFLRIPTGIKFGGEKSSIQVYEIDPLEGVSPLNVPLSSKYATLLADINIDAFSKRSLAVFLEGIKFVRPSNSKYFAIALNNFGAEPGHFVVKGLKFVQSGHVSVHPRAAKTQQIKTLNFRIIGPDLAEDYSFMGNEGFNFSIERLVAGERKSVLFKANSLLDLLHAGAAKIFSNARRRAVESHKSKSSGWRRSETGSGDRDRTIIKGINHWTDLELEKLGGGENNNRFEVFNAQQIRSRSELLLPRITSGVWKELADYFNVIQAVGTLGSMSPTVNSNGDLNDAWQNRLWNDFFSFSRINGLISMAINPFSPVEDILYALETPDLVEKARILAGIFAFTTGPLALTGGSSSSLSLSAVVGASLGINPMPTIINNATYGSSGNITDQASEAIYSYSQYLNTGYDENIVTHEEVPDTDSQRIRGAEVMWQGQIADIITGSIPLNFTLPATAGKMHCRTADDSLRVRFGSGVGKSISVDFWFDMIEEEINDDN